MPRTFPFRVALLLTAAACGRDLITSPGSATPAHGVVISLAVPGPCLVGGCDPLAGRTHLGLVSVVNTGSSTAYLEACGDSPAMAEQQFVDGEWIAVDPPEGCPVTFGPVVLAPGDSIRQNWFFAPGTKRIVLGVASSSSGSDELLANSAPVNIP